MVFELVLEIIAVEKAVKIGDIGFISNERQGLVEEASLALGGRLGGNVGGCALHCVEYMHEKGNEDLKAHWVKFRFSL